MELIQIKGYRYKESAEGRTRTGTQVALRGILSPLRPTPLDSSKNIRVDKLC